MAGNHNLLRQHLAHESDTTAFGAKLAPLLNGGMVVYLRGELGAGKTTLVRGLLRGLGVTGRVKSPTYTLVEPYVISQLYLYHFDFYRFSRPEEWAEAGFREYFNGDAVCLIEWPEKVGGQLPAADLEIAIEVDGDARHITLIADTEAGQTCLAGLQT
jgi:tRNA threonylcarbamoyladenosine biosynthesis protein TsaE